MIRLDPSARGFHGYAVLVLLALLLLPSVAHAVEPYPIDDLLVRFNDGVRNSWLDAVRGVAERLFWSLALISLTWTMCMMLFRRADFAELFAELVRFIVLTGVFWWLLDEGSVLIWQILDSMRLLGGDGSGGDGMLQPSSLLRSGYRLFFAVAKYSEEGEWKDADKIVGMILAAVILALIALAAVSMMLITLMTWILGYAGLFLLGFGGARWTSGVAINYYKHVLAVGMSYFVMLLLSGIGNQFLNDYSTEVAADITLPNLGIMLVAAIVLLALLVRIPAMVSSMVLGSRFGGAAGTSFSGHVMALGGTAIAAGVSSASSGAQALYSAYNAPSITPPPAPMISMPTIQMPAASAAPSAASAPMPTPVISVHHLDGNSMNPPPVTLNTVGMYPPPAGAAQSSVFGATPSAQDVARAQVQAGPGSAGGAGGAGAAAAQAAPATTGTATTTATAGTDTDSATDRTPLPPALAATQRPSIDAEALQRNPGADPAPSATNLAASTASLPASPMSDPHAAAPDTDDVRADTDDVTRQPTERALPEFSSFASQPLSGPMLAPTERGNTNDEDESAPRGDGTDRSAGSGRAGNAPLLAQPNGLQPNGPQPPGASSSAAIDRPGGRASAQIAPSVPRASGAAPSTGAAASSGRTQSSNAAAPSDRTQSPNAAASGGRDGRDAGASASAGRGDNAADSDSRTLSPAKDATAAGSAPPVAQVIPAADRPYATASTSAPAAAPGSATASGAAARGWHKPGWWQRILHALRLRRPPGRGDDDAG